MKHAKHVIRVLLAAMLAAAALLLPPALADGDSGTCGDGVTWQFSSSGVLTISGSGAMADYSTSSLPPWYEHREQITAIEIGPGVTSIGSYSFLNCAVISVTVPGTVSVVGTRAFSNCRSLTSAVLESGVKTLKDNAFYFCGQLSEVTVPGDIARIEECAFYGCYGIKKVNWPGTRDQWRNVTVTRGNTNAALALFGYDTGSAGSGLTWTMDSEGTLTITGKGTIYHSSSYPDWIMFANLVKHVVIEDGTTAISADAFRTLTLMKTLVIPNSVKTIGKGAFYLCSGLETVTMPGDAVYDGDSYYDDPRCFEGCDKIKQITFTSDPQPSFSWYYFRDSDAASIETVCFSDTVSSVGALENLSGLKKIVLPDSVTEILAGAFSRSRNLETVEGGGGVKSCPAEAFAETCPFITAPGFVLLGSTLVKYNGEASTLVIPDGVKAVSDSAFYKCGTLKKVVFPKGLEYIGSSSFRACTLLEEAVIPDGVQTVGHNAFAACAALRTITVPDSVTFLGDGAFDGCASLTAASLGSGLEALGSQLFRGCTSLTRVTLGCGLKSIGSSSFDGCSALKQLDIPAGVEKIGSGAFRGCAALESAPLPAALGVIESNTFQGCAALKRADFPEGLTKIGSNAFSGCAALERVAIPASLEELETAAFKDCSGLKEIVWLAADCKVSGKPFTASAPEGGAVCALTVGPGVNTLPTGLFSGANHVKILTLEGGCDLSTAPFGSMTGLESAALKNCSGPLGEGFFSGCTALRTVTLSRGITSIGDRAFNGCSSLESITLPSTVTALGNSAFYNCSSLTLAELGEGITDIGDYAFYQCASLRSARLPSTLQRLGRQAFYRCDSLEGTSVSGGALLYCGWALNAADSAQGELSLPSGTAGVADGFINDSYGKNITSVVLPEGLKYVGADAFSRLASLTSVTLPSTLRKLGDYAFKDCTQLSRVIGSPAGMTVGKDVFKNTALGSSQDFLIIGDALISYLKSDSAAVTAPSGIKSIAYRAFAGHGELTSVKLPSGLEEIGERAFEDCAALASADLPSSLKVLGAYAFSGAALTAADVPAGVASIGEGAFAGCPLTRVTLREGLREIGGSAFGYCGSLKEIEFPSTLEAIGEAAFAGTGLTRVDVPAGASIGKGAFRSSSLEKLTVGGEPVSFLRFVKQYGREVLMGTPINTAVTEGWYTEDNVRYWWTADSLTSKVGRIYARHLIETGEVASIKDSYDWLCSNCGYTFKSGTHLSASDGPFFYGTASCNGVALAQKCFLDELGYACYLMEGRVNGTYGNVGHAWIEVLSGGWRLIDATDTRKGDYSTYMLSETTAYNTDWDTSHWYTINWDTLESRREKCLATYAKRVNSNSPLTFTLQEDGTYWVTGCVNGAERVAVPAVHNGAAVTGVGEFAFRDCVWLQSVTLPEGVKYLGRGAFYGCIGLEDICLPSSLAEMGQEVFSECVSLETADFSRTRLAVLPSGTFYHCVSLIKLMLSDSMNNVDAISVSGRGALRNATSTEYCMTVYAPTGSAAQARAEALGYAFVSTGEYNSAPDALQLLLHTAVSKYVYKLSGSESDWDVSGDGVTDAYDAVKLLRDSAPAGGRTVLAVYDASGRMLRTCVFTAGSGGVPDLTGAAQIRAYFLGASGAPSRQCLARTL